MIIQKLVSMVEKDEDQDVREAILECFMFLSQHSEYAHFFATCGNQFVPRRHPLSNYWALDTQHHLHARLF
jgi:hypothetical protein